MAVAAQPRPSSRLFRRVLFWSHLLSGVIAGTIVLIMSVTGVLLTYERQIVASAESRAYRVASPDGASDVRPGLDAVLAAVRLAEPDALPATVTVRADTGAPIAVAAGARTFFVDPYTAHVMGEAGAQPRAFFRSATAWHRWLGVSGEGRATARRITGACNLAFLFLVVSGAYLWLPPARTWQQWRNAAWFRRGLRAKARDFNWHNVVGLWSVVPLFVIVLSGVVISYPWASDLVYRAAGEAPPSRAPAAPGSSPRSAARDRDIAAAVAPSLDPLWTRAERQVEGWRSISVRVPSASAETAVFTIDTGTGGQPQKRGTLTLNARTADVVKWEPFSELSTGRRWRSYLRFGHTGEVAGLAGQTIAGMASLGAVVLVWTGLSLAVRRAAAWRVRRSAGRLEQVGRTRLRAAATERDDRDRVA